MLIIGITGGTGAGKTSALKAAKTLGALVLDCDTIYHELLENSSDMKSELETRFNGVLKDEGIDRGRLGRTVFNDPAALRTLNDITHKYVNAEIDRRIAKWETQGGKTAAIDAIALIESGQNEKCDIVVGITAPLEDRLSRIMRRDGITREQAQLSVSAQPSDEFYKKNCDHILENTCGTPAEFESKCKEFFSGLLS